MAGCVLPERPRSVPIPLWKRPAGTASFHSMDTEARNAITALSDAVSEQGARLTEHNARLTFLSDTVAEQNGRLTVLSDTMSAGFARMDRYFELQQKQYLELRDEFAELRARVDALSERVGRLEHEVALLRDHVTRDIAEIRLELRELRGRSGQTDELRREIAELTVRVERLERRQPD